MRVYGSKTQEQSVTSQAFAAPLAADAIDGEVVLTAPGGAASLSLTPDAALKTAEALQTAARSAQSQPEAGGLAE